MERKEFNLDLLAPKDIVSYTYEDNYDTYFAEATKRLNILWAEYLKRGKMETENQKSTKSLIREAINKELQNVINSADKEQKMRHLENALILKLGLGVCDEIDGGELKNLVFAHDKLKSDNNLSRNQEVVDGIVDEYRGDFEGSGRC